MLLTWLLEVLLTRLLGVLLAHLALPLLTLSLLLIGGGTHAGASAIRLGAGLVAIAAHGGTGLVDFRTCWRVHCPAAGWC